MLHRRQLMPQRTKLLQMLQLLLVKQTKLQ
nr:MAG TPA_asm: hypothetical protein [Bacteriophage sp.]